MQIRMASATRSWVEMLYFNYNCNFNYKGPFLLFSGGVMEVPKKRSKNV